jgi:hypothetical protein
MESEPFGCAVASLIRKVEELSENCWNYDRTYDRTRNCESVEIQVMRSGCFGIQRCGNYATTVPMIKGEQCRLALLHQSGWR